MTYIPRAKSTRVIAGSKTERQPAEKPEPPGSHLRSSATDHAARIARHSQASHHGDGREDRRRKSSNPYAASGATAAVKPARKYQSRQICTRNAECRTISQTRPNGLLMRMKETTPIARNGTMSRNFRRRRTHTKPNIAGAPR